MSSPVCCSRKQQHVWENNPVSHTFPQQAMTGTHSCLTGTQSLTSSGPTITVSADEGLKRRLPLLLYCVSMCVFLYIHYFDCLSASQFEVGLNRLGVLRRCTHSDTKVKCRTLDTSHTQRSPFWLTEVTRPAAITILVVSTTQMKVIYLFFFVFDKCTTTLVSYFHLVNWTIFKDFLTRTIMLLVS